MNKLTGKEIIAILEKIGMSVSDFAYNEYPIPTDFKFSDTITESEKIKESALKLVTSHPLYNNYKEREQSEEFQKILQDYAKIPMVHKLKIDEYLTSLSVGQVEEIEQHGGEGEGDNWYSVKYFKDHDVYLKVQGYYQSHYGTDFSDWKNAVTEVKPKEKTITIYE